MARFDLGAKVRVRRDDEWVLAEVVRQTDPDELIGPDGRPRDGYGVRLLEGGAAGLPATCLPEDMRAESAAAHE